MLAKRENGLFEEAKQAEESHLGSSKYRIGGPIPLALLLKCGSYSQVWVVAVIHQLLPMACVNHSQETFFD